MTNPTPHGQVPAIQRYKIGYHSDDWGQRSSTPSGIPDASGSWVRYADHVAALAVGQQEVAPAEPTREFLERTLGAMEGVIDVADRKTVEFDALRSCVIDLTLMLFKPAPPR